MPQTPGSVVPPCAYLHIANAGTTEGKQTPGALLSMNVNSATAAGTITLYDQIGNTVGSVVIGAYSFGTADILPLNLPIGPSGGLLFKNGLLIIATGTVDATIGFR